MDDIDPTFFDNLDEKSNEPDPMHHVAKFLETREASTILVGLLTVVILLVMQPDWIRTDTKPGSVNDGPISIVKVMAVTAVISGIAFFGPKLFPKN